MRSFKYIFFVFPILILLQSKAWSDVLPGPALPDTVSKSLIQQKPVPRVAPPTLLTEQKKEETPGGEAAKKIKFKFNGLVLQGNHVYSAKHLAPLYEKKLHQVITVAELFTIVQNITNYYRNNGYIITRALLPPQHVKGGIVKVQVIEGYIDKVDVGGHPHGAKCLVKAYGKQISKCRPLELSRMEKYLFLANEIPGTQVKAVLAPSKNKTGAADLTLLTENRILSSYFSYDNYGTRYIGPQQMNGNIAANSVFASGDALQLTVTKTPKGIELTFLDLNYNLPILDEGARILFGGTRTKTHPLFVLEPVQIQGETNNYYANFSYPLMRTKAKNLTLLASFNYLDTHVTTLGEELYTDHLRPIGLGINYNFADRYYGSNNWYLDMRQGLPIFGYTSDTNQETALTSHPGGHANFTKIDLALNRLQSIKANFSAFGLLRGQYAFVPLLASEQFTFGGSQLGRGYDIAELIGDRGLAGTLELRYDLAISKFYLQSLQFYAFYDFGKVWNFINPVGVPLSQSGTSTGLGVRFYLMKYVSGNFMWTQTLTKQVAAEELIGEGRKPRVFFSVIAVL